MTDSEFIAVLSDLYSPNIFPKPFHVLSAAIAVDGGASIESAARNAKTTPTAIRTVANSSSRVNAVLGLSDRDTDGDSLRRAQLILGQMTLGVIAERVFEELYRSETATDEFELQDERAGRSDTDYRVLDALKRPIFRINIKFHGSQFRRAEELVGLVAADCFALATYKIHGALKKQEDERLPYVFAIVGVPNLTAEVVGQAIPARYAAALALVHSSPKSGVGKRAFEEAIVDRVLHTEPKELTAIYNAVSAAQWYVLSARRANILLKDRLFERVYALRIRNFARMFRGAEVDMHFSLKEDLTTLHEFLTTLRDGGMPKLVTHLERGEF